MGGEKIAKAQNEQLQQGSPPHGRGKVSLIGVTDIAPGITPAWAGKRGEYGEQTARPQDHPRMGGEKSSGCSDLV